MSLINDALKRAQQTTLSNEPPRLDELELRPIEPVQPPPLSPGSGTKWVIWAVVLLVVAVNITLWSVFKNRGNATEVAARTIDEPFEALVAQGEQGSRALEVRAPELPPQPAVSMAASLESSGPPTNAMTLNPPEFQRPEFRLKTVVVHPTHPSAMINNRVVFVGDTVEGYTVSDIGKHAVTLTLDRDKVVISLP